MEILFKTVHGSRLYNLATGASDFDYYTVVSKKSPVANKQIKAKYAKQTIIDDEDSMVVDFGTWVSMCQSGVPQACEAMFSDMAIVDKIADFRRQFRIGTTAADRYLRTIKSFALSEDATLKKKRHALRLGLNIGEALRTGRFNPTLNDNDAAYITERAMYRTHEEVYGEALCMAW